MKLSIVERLILPNQLEILELLKPGDAKYLEYRRRALEAGYELEYDELASGFSDGLSSDQCNEVIEILEMHRALNFSFGELKDKAGITDDDIKFEGFDGNNETSLMAYAKYFCEDPPSGRYTELGSPSGFNSNKVMLPTYRKMHIEWLKAANKHELTVGDIDRILTAGHPWRRKA